jgi:hypothetical protein
MVFFSCGDLPRRERPRPYRRSNENTTSQSHLADNAGRWLARAIANRYSNKAPK